MSNGNEPDGQQDSVEPEEPQDDDPTAMVVDCSRTIPTPDIINETPLPGHNALTQVYKMENERVAELAEKKEGPFLAEIRIRCPDKGFGFRHVSNCIDCPMFGGVGARTIIGARTPDEGTPLHSKAKYMILCQYPSTRPLHYLPED